MGTWQLYTCTSMTWIFWDQHWSSEGISLHSSQDISKKQYLRPFHTNTLNWIEYTFDAHWLHSHIMRIRFIWIQCASIESTSGGGLEANSISIHKQEVEVMWQYVRVNMRVAKWSVVCHLGNHGSNVGRKTSAKTDGSRKGVFIQLCSYWV